MSPDEVLLEFPELEREDLQAVFAYAAQHLTVEHPLFETPERDQP